MPWNVILEDESCRTLGRVEAISGFLPKVSGRAFRLLSYVDPYGDTVFNRLQMEDLLADWEAVLEEVKHSDQYSKWEAVKRMAERCKSNPHMYLRFEGD